MYSKAVINGELRYELVYFRPSGEMVFHRTPDNDPLQWSQLAQAPSADIMPAWSPDGERIALRRQHGDGTASLVLASKKNRTQPWSSDNVALEKLVPLDDLRDPLAWSPDGERIAFAAGGDSADADILAVNAYDGHVETLVSTGADETSPSWTEEGGLFYERERDVWLKRPGEGERRLTHTGQCRYPVVSPDGTRVAWVTESRGVGIMDVASGAVVYAGAPRQIAYAPAWSLDGEHIAVSAEDWGSWDVYMMKADASNVLLLTKHASRETMPTWNPDGRTMAVVSDRGGNFGVWLLRGLDAYERRLDSRVRVEVLTPPER
jgi:Tol biopolymer transport system component